MNIEIKYCLFCEINGPIDEKYIFSETKFFCHACGRMNSNQMPSDYTPMAYIEQDGFYAYVPVDSNQIVGITDEAKQAIYAYLISTMAEMDPFPLQSLITNALNRSTQLILKGMLVKFLVDRFMGKWLSKL